MSEQKSNKMARAGTKKRVSQYYPTLVAEKLFVAKYRISLLFCLFCIVFFGLKYQYNHHQISAFLIGAVILNLFCVVSAVIFSSPHLHYIRIRRKPSKFASLLFIPYGIEEDPSMPLSSLSQCISLRGTNAEKVAFAGLHFGVWTGLSCLISRLSTNYELNQQIPTDTFCALLGLFGVWMLCTYQIEIDLGFDHDLHLIGVACFAVGTLLSLCIQQKFNDLSIYLVLATTTTGILYGAGLIASYLISFEPNSKKVHWLSLYSLFSEMLVLSILVFSFCLYLYNF